MTKQQKLARKMKQKLDAEQFLTGITLSEADVDNLNAIAAGLPVTGAGHILRAIGLKADLLVARPTQRIDMRAVTLSVVDPYALPPSNEQPALPPALARPELVTALPPASVELVRDRPRNLAELKRQEWEKQEVGRRLAPLSKPSQSTPLPAPGEERKPEDA